MVGRDVEQCSDIAGKALGQIDLIARQFEDIDPASWQWILPEHWQTYVAAHPHRQSRLANEVVDQRGGGRLAVGAGNADHAVRRQIRPGHREQFDVTDDWHADRSCGLGNRVAVERHAGGHDHPVHSRDGGRNRIGQLHLIAELGLQGHARFLAAVPGHDFRPAVHQRAHHRHSRAREAENRIARAGEGGGDDHRSFSVDRPIRARTMETIQKRITTVSSFQPFCSKWW